MEAKDWEPLKRLFEQARLLPAEEQAAFLEDACSDDPHKQAQLASLMAAAREASGLFDSLAEAVLSRAPWSDEGEEVTPSAGAPRHIGHYRLIRQLGVGGMGEVHLAEDTQLHRQVAIKLLLPSSSGAAAARRRLLAEARMAATLDHPNICSVFEVGEEEEHSFIVMQYIDGESLHSWMKRGPVPADTALDVAIQIADGLSEAHEHGIVHRDIKPSNIMIGKRGLVKVLDFGIAKEVRVEPDADSETITRAVTTHGVLLGTIPYMSPEQLRGRPVDVRSDVFSFSVLLYELVTGEHPFLGTTKLETIARILTVDPPPVRASPSDSSPGLGEILEKGLSKDRDQRYEDARSLVKDLRSCAGQVELASGVGELRPKTTGHVMKRLLRSPGLLATALVAAVGLVALGRATLSDRGAGGSAPSGIDGIAVLPLANLTRATEIEYVADGLTESIINNLSQLPDVRVVSRYTVFQYKDTVDDPSVVGRDLGVEAVVTGRIRDGPGGLEVGVELIDTRTNRQLWGQQYRQTDDLSVTQAQISGDLLRSLGRSASRADRAVVSKRYTDNQEAYRLYLRGNFRYYRFGLADVREAIELYKQAVALDPDYALAYASMARAYSLLAGNYVAASTVVDEWKSNAQKALALDEGLAEAHHALALAQFRYDWDWQTATRSFETAIRLNPNNADARTAYATLHCTQDRFEEAKRQLDRALELDPLSVYHNSTLALCLFFARRFTEAIEQYDVTLELDRLPGTILVQKANVYSQMGRYEEAFATLDKAQAVATNVVWTLGGLGYAYARSGRHEEARRILARMHDSFSPDELNPVTIAQIHGALGELGLAMDWLERAYEERHPWIFSVAADPMFDSLDSEPRMQALIQVLRLPG